MSKTLQDIRNIAYSILKTNENASAYPTVLMDSFINKAQNDICIGNLKNLKTLEMLSKPTLGFLAKEVFYKSVQRSTISAPLTTWSDTVTVSDTSPYPSSGAIWIEGMIVSYTSRTATQFTGCTGVIADMPAWSKLLAMYLLPSDFSQMTSAYYITGTAWPQRRMIGMDYRDFKESLLNQTTFQVQRSDSFLNVWEIYYTIVNGVYFLPFSPWTGFNIRFEYQKLPTTFNLITDLATVPDTYALSTIPYIAVAEMLFNRWEPDIGIELNNFGYSNVKTMYSFYTGQQKELNYNQRVRTARDGLLNF